MLTYPVHQAAGILFCKADLVPAGQDQLPHLELTRTIARRFNQRYGAGATVFPQPEVPLSDAPLLLGTDSARMGKSWGNAIGLAAGADETARLVRSARADGRRRVTYEPDTRPEVASLLLLGALGALCQGRTPRELADETGPGGAAALKRTVTEAVNACLTPVRARGEEDVRVRGRAGR